MIKFFFSSATLSTNVVAARAIVDMDQGRQAGGLVSSSGEYLVGGFSNILCGLVIFSEQYQV